MRAPKLQKTAYYIAKSLPINCKKAYQIKRSMPLNCKSANVCGLVTVWKTDDRKGKKEKAK